MRRSVVSNKIISGYNLDLQSQIKIFCEIIQKNETLKKVLEGAQRLGLKNYYIGASCLAQTVWNFLSGFPLNHGINDIDIAYFDDSNFSLSEQKKVYQQANQIFGELPFKIDVQNQARVHLWYEKYFGYLIKPYHSLEAAINTWPTTATSIGVRMECNNNWVVYSPFGLNDVFGMIVRPNKAQITQKIYEDKVNRWASLWPGLKITHWDE